MKKVEAIVRHFKLEEVKNALNEQGIHGIGMIMLDLDHFKRVNDTADHLMGSYVIKEVGNYEEIYNLFFIQECRGQVDISI